MHILNGPHKLAYIVSQDYIGQTIVLNFETKYILNAILVV